LASRLSFFLYNSVPDQELLDAAANGSLSQPSTLNAQVDRLLTKEPYLQRFVRHTLSPWLHLDGDLDSPGEIKNENGSLSMKDVAQQQYLLLYDLVINDRNISEIFYGSELYMNKSIANFLGVDSSSFGSALQRVPASVSEGLEASYFTSLHFANTASASSDPLKTMVTSRGKVVAKNFLCESIPVNELDPAAVAEVLGPEAPFLSQIEVGNIRRNHVSCMGCHKEIDKMGMGLEFVDNFGRLRTEYPDGKKIEINFDMKYSETPRATDLTSFLKSISKDERLHSCFIKTLVSKVGPVYLEESNPCASQIYRLNSKQGIRSYIKGIATSKLFVLARRGQ